MGRGRQKAKHTKVARELKYSVPETNYSELERELAGNKPRNEESSSDELSKWSEYLDDEDELDGDEDADDEYYGSQPARSRA